MNLVIHDLDKKEWAKIKRDYAGWEVVSDRGTIRPCVGCFRCWYKTPGQCVIEDGYENMGVLIHRAEEVVVISRYTYGGFSGFVKNVFDRSLGYILPQFEVINNETHHKKRYAEDKPFSFIFYGNISFSEEEKECARRYVTAVCANIRGHVKEVIFRECENAAPENTGNAEVDSGQISGDNPGDGSGVNSRDSSGGDPASGKTVLLNGSMRSEKGNSAIFAQQLAALLQDEQKRNVPDGSGITADPEIVALKPYLDHLPDLLPILEDAEKIVLCLPLYVDGLPAQTIRFMEWFRAAYRGKPKKIYLLANMGLYESCQLINLFSAVRQWCALMNLEYCGGLGISAGELLGVMARQRPFGAWPSQKAAAGLRQLAEAAGRGGRMEDIFAEPNNFPRFLYIMIANNNWNNLARRAGIRPKDLYRKL